MCTVLLAYRWCAAFPLVLAGNRDERYDRPAHPAQLWDDAPQVLAGRDRVSGGTWFGVTRAGRWAVVTNVHARGDDSRVRDLSRGALVGDYLRGDEAPGAYLEAACERGHRYLGFNLLVGDRADAWYLSNRAGPPRQLAPGLYGVSNHLLDTPWHKVVHGRRALAEAIERIAGDPRDADARDANARGADARDADARDADEALARVVDAAHVVLADRQPAADETLPWLGQPIAFERALSAIFVATERYGTCASTVLAMSARGRVRFQERTTNRLALADPAAPRVVTHTFALSNPR